MSCIVGIAGEVPEHKYKQSDLLTYMSRSGGLTGTDKERWLSAVYRHSGIEERYSVLPDFTFDGGELFDPYDKADPSVEQRMKAFEDHAPSLLLKACKKVFNRIEDHHNKPLDPQSITHVITITCTGLSAPGLEIKLVEDLGLKDSVQCFAVNFMGCYAAFPALRIADALCKADPEAMVLIAGVELCTLHFQNKNDEDTLLANALFSDGAGAMVVTSCDKAYRDFSQDKLRLDLFRTEHILAGKSDMAWGVGSTGFNMRLTSYVPELLSKAFGPAVQKLGNVFPDAEISYWAIHPGGRRILDLCKKGLSLNGHLDPSYDILSRYGNMSSVTVMFVLQELWERQESWDKGKKLLAAGFGPGLTMETALMEPVI